MKIIFYSSVFYPSVGGLETVSETLADHLAELGAQVTLITETPDKGVSKNFPYRVIRRPSKSERYRLIRKADIVYSNGASMALFFFAKLLNKPFVWTHAGYQLQCIDGGGFKDGEPAPLTPRESIKYYWKKFGFQVAFVEGIKLYLRRFVGKILVDKNIAITNWVAKRQPLPRQMVIYNPFPVTRFKTVDRNVPKEFDFIYVGRLTSEKGVLTLLRAFRLLVNHERYQHKRLVIVGDGNWRSRYQEYAEKMQLNDRVVFTGSKTGTDLLDIVSRAEIAVVPSEIEEPMGGVAVEMMAAGKNIIVSRDGGLAECIGDAGLTFPNGDAEALSQCMQRLLEDTVLRQEHKERAIFRVQSFNEAELSRSYYQTFQEIISQKREKRLFFSWKPVLIRDRAFS